jgi:hypothetical protein
MQRWFVGNHSPDWSLAARLNAAMLNSVALG